MREMKDSGIEWIGKIPCQWTTKPNKIIMSKYKQIISVYKGETILSLTMNGVIVRDLENLKGKRPTSFNGYQKILPGNLLMCLFDIDVTPRCIGLIKNNGLTSPAYSQFIINEGYCVAYYYYYYLMLDNTKELLHLAKNLRHSLTEDQLGSVHVPVPPLTEQQAIADFLDAKCADIDSLTGDIQKQIDILKEYKKSVITQAVTKGLDPNVEMKDSGIAWIGKIPVNWELCRLKNLLANVDRPIVDGPFGSDMKNEEYVDDGVPIIQLGNIRFTYHKLTPLKFVTPSKAKQLSGHIAKSGDIVIAKMMPAGKAAIVSNKYPKFVISADCIRVIFDKSKVYYRYIVLAINTLCQKEAEINAKGATRSRINLSKVKNLYIVLPELKEQKYIADFLDAKCANIDAIISGKQKQLDVLKEYKKSLIYEYVTGKKEVPCRE